MGRGTAGAGPHRLPGPLRRRLTLTLVVLLALFLANTAIVIVAARARDHSRAIVETELNPAQIDVERLLTALVNQESGERGYQLTLDQAFLDIYQVGQSQESGTVAALRHELAHHPEALASLTAVESSAAAWRLQAGAEIEAGRASVRTPAQVTASALQGKALFDRVRSAVATLTGQVAQLQNQAEHAQGADDAWLLRSVVTVLITALLVVVLGLVVLRRSLTRPLEDLVASIEGVKEGDLAHPVVARGPREFVQVGAAVDAMRARMLEDASETLNRSLVMATEEQRRQLAADIHDDPTQALTAVTLRLQRLRRRLQGADAEMLADAERAAAAALGRLRHLIFELHSPVLDSDGLIAALRAYVDETFDPERTRCTVEGDVSPDLPPSVRALAYRLARGALLNAAKHADPTQVTTTVEQDGGRLAVRVRDDGRGFDAATARTPVPGHLGLITSAEFVRAAGGVYSVESAPGEGTSVSFWLPAG